LVGPPKPLEGLFTGRIHCLIEKNPILEGDAV